MSSAATIRVKHEFSVIPEQRCLAFSSAVEELERARLRAQEIAFDALPAFFRELPAWRCLVSHHLAGSRRAWSDGGAAASALAAALGARQPTEEWAWLEAAATVLDAARVGGIARALAELTAVPNSPRELILDGLSRSAGPFDANDAAHGAAIARWLAWPDGLDHGATGALIEVLRALCAAVHDAARNGDGLLYLSYSDELTPV